MRHLLVVALLPLPVLAEDVTLPTVPEAVTLYGTGARIVRSAETAELPAGTHRILLPLPQIASFLDEPRLAVGSATLVGLERRDALPVEPAAPTPPEREVETRAEAVALRRDELARIEGQIEGLEARIAFARSLEGDALEGAEEPAGQAAGLIDVIGREIADARAGIAELEEERRPLEDALEEAQADLRRAQLLLQAAPPPAEIPGGLIATVTLDAPAAIPVEIAYLSGAAGWTPDYELRLDTEAASLALTRRAAIRQATGEAWEDVSLTLSTADPRRALAPAEPGPSIAVIGDDRPAPGIAMQEDAASFAGAAPRVLEMAAPARATAVARGLSLRYEYDEPVTLAPTGHPAQIVLETLDLPSEVGARAVPRVDETAFLIVRATNDSGETLVPGPAAFYRDGDFIGGTSLPLWAAGAEEELPFGPLDEMRLDFAVLGNERGDTGVVTTALTREVRARFTVENTGNEARDVRALYALPISEQENLEVEVAADPRPDEEDVDGVRGVAAWDLSIGAGETAEVDLTFTLEWPEGRTLFWQP
ncbi:uncharacterized protein (TIGR02231 family) [Hasllibacter halocynthiae]|uniref:Uncharacterized protein (TIGR02231 family) n=1 Tax=Hasllibacter halocynthiae TaxID=595589 RepID=A0A2T0X213_9RHOB|nr:DUF4139 domain-containing protein [Hasllibacter halocynthiae]PRY92978.1 uncharacterized protein (TIGR02231 family) [Hasllibacter halocynthiae]